MRMNELLMRAGRKRRPKRVGRGSGSGCGKTSGRGHNGAKSRSGWKRRGHFEGGQMPLVRRVPKRGFSNVPFRVRYDIVNLSVLEERFDDGAEVDLKVLVERGIVKSRHGRLKILGSGELSKKLTVRASKISESARQKVEKAGGQVEMAIGKSLRK